MVDKDIDGIFKDFNFQEDSKPKPHKELKKELQKDFKNNKPDDEIKHLKDELKDLRDQVRDKKRNSNVKGPGSTERIILISVIILLLGYIVIDYALYHQNNNIQIREDKINIVSEEQIGDVINKTEKSLNKTSINETVEKNDTTETVEEEDKETLSGEIKLIMGNIISKVDDDDEDMGFITRIYFSINNSKEETLKPIVNVFIYDENLRDPWETKSRGEYTFPAGIKPGELHTASITVSPKTFRNLDLEKHIRLVLNSTEDGFIDYVNKDLIIS